MPEVLGLQAVDGARATARSDELGALIRDSALNETDPQATLY